MLNDSLHDEPREQLSHFFPYFVIIILSTTVKSQSTRINSRDLPIIIYRRDISGLLDEQKH